MRSVIVSLFTVMLLLMIFSSSLSMSLAEDDEGRSVTVRYDDERESMNEEEDEEVGFGLIRGAVRMLAGAHKKMTCDKYPRVCRVAGSTGRDCCKKKCVNVDKDQANCGKCGKKCKYSEVCCKGKCVNVLKDEKNCGGCGKKCSKGDTCRYGMCSYA
ncbi:hypothetical protein QQ045_027224 [Rhodiola kirilowii]